MQDNIQEVNRFSSIGRLTFVTSKLLHIMRMKRSNEYYNYTATYQYSVPSDVNPRTNEYMCLEQ